MPVNGGYGESPYGYGAYGSNESVTPYLVSASSNTPFEIEAVFSQNMDPDNPALLDPSSYTMTPVAGAPAIVQSVRVGESGVLSVILTHSGTTLGGIYQISAAGPTNFSGTPISDVPVTLFTRGSPPNFTVSEGPNPGADIVLTFDQPLIPTGDLADIATYLFTQPHPYPIPFTQLHVVYPYMGDDAKVLIRTKGQTSVEYTCHVASNAIAMNFDGSYLPSDSHDFLAFTGGFGSSAVVDGTLAVSSASHGGYAWLFWDAISGKIAPNTTFRMDFHFDASGDIFNPPLSSYSNGQFLVVSLDDAPVGHGGTHVDLVFERSGGTNWLRVVSGDFNQVFTIDWANAPMTVSVVRNLLAGFYTVLVEGQPIMTTALANFTAASTLSYAGVSFGVSNNTDVVVTNWLIHGIKFTASQTIYSAAWNFLHDWQTIFTGSNHLTRDFILTNRGPLTKSWGDMTPATKQDVGVTVNGVAVEVADVNPHIGKITLAVPVPYLAPDDPDVAQVKASYMWLASPVMQMTGLNEHGQVLNKWDRNITGIEGNITTDPGEGAPDIARFPYCVVLGPMDTPEPILIGHRYIGFEKEYSALLNSDTTLVFNANPNQYEVPGFEQLPQGSTAAYEATMVPAAATPPWTLVGADNGTLVGDGTYRVVDAQSGAFSSPTPPCTVFKQSIDMGFPASMTLVSRYLVNSTTPDGVFTGVGIGFHQDKRLYLVGNLLINNVQHVGWLKDSRYPHLAASWDIGPKTNGTIETSNTVSVPNDASFPSSFKAGSRFQIFAPHSQAGIYTATHVVPQSDGTVTITVSTPFPAIPNRWGNKYPDVYFEVLWLNLPTTYRLTLSPPTVATGPWHIKLALAGETSVQKVFEDDAFGADVPQVATSSLALFLDQGEPDKTIGTVFWGSLSYGAMNDATWSFVRYGIVPNATAYRGHSKLVHSTFSVLPENEPDPAWFQTQAFGSSTLVPQGMILKSTSANPTLDTTFAYGRDEPFFVKDSNVDLTAEFKVDTGVLGSGDCEIVLNDGTREVRLATLLVTASGTPLRMSLVRMPAISFAGLIPLAVQGWITAQAGDGTATTNENDLVFDHVANTPMRYKQTLADSGIPLVLTDLGERVFEAQFAVSEDFVPGAGGKTGIFIAADVGATAAEGVGVTVWMNGATPTVSLVLPTGLVSVQDYPFPWNDGQFHTYRVVASIAGGGIALILDNVLQVPTLNPALFAGQGSGLNRCVFGAYTNSGQGQVRWRSASYSMLPNDAEVGRLVGVYLGGDPDDIDNWKIPRTDSTTVPNSFITDGCVPELWDWRSIMQVRILRTWDWGVTVYRPDLPLPPYWVAPPGDTPGARFTTQTTEPTAAWISVEYSNLPYTPRATGFIGFGSFDSRSVTQQGWASFGFRLFKPITDDWKTPQHMVLNQANVVTSGEPILDDTLEMASIMPLPDLRRVYLKPTNIFARDVYKIVDGVTIYTSDKWTFDVEAQLVTLNMNPDGTGVYFTGESVTVVYYPGRPYTDTYLETQKLLDSMTLLNERTPPVPKSQHNPDTQFIYADGEYKAFIHEPDPDAMYESMKFMTVDNGGWNNLITSIGEGMLQPGQTGWSPNEGDPVYDSNGIPTGSHVGQAVGGHVIGIEGDLYWEYPISAKWTDTLQSFVLLDMSGPPADALDFFEQGLGQYLFASGGSFMSPVVDGGGNVIGDQPAGGLMNSGLVLFPSKAVK